MLKWLVIIAAGYILIKMLSNDRKKKAAVEKEEVQTRAATGEMVKDPVCGAFVPVDSDIRVRNGDKVIHFCSYECRDKYIEQLEAQSETKEIDS